MNGLDQLFPSDWRLSTPHQRGRSQKRHYGTAIRHKSDQGRNDRRMNSVHVVPRKEKSAIQPGTKDDQADAEDHSPVVARYFFPVAHGTRLLGPTWQRRTFPREFSLSLCRSNSITRTGGVSAVALQDNLDEILDDGGKSRSELTSRRQTKEGQ